MKQPRPNLPNFHKGDVLQASGLQTLRSAIAGLIAADGSSVHLPLPLAVVLDEELSTASDAMRGATQGLATVLHWNSNGGSEQTGAFEETTRQITVWNHSESTTHTENTFGVAHWIESHWWFFGDCQSMGERSLTD